MSFLKDKTTKKINYYRLSAVFAVIAILTILVPAGLAHAEGGVIDFITDPVGWITLKINLLIAKVAGFFLMLSVLAIRTILEMSVNIVNSVVVQAGFSIILSVANLGFVAAIIFIAIATIMRIQTYALKQTLWKLIVAALLVNFSLVFAGAIINVADQLTFQFLKVFPGSNGAAQNFTDNLVTAFQPQRIVIPQSDPSVRVRSAADLQKGLEGFRVDSLASADPNSSLGAGLNSIVLMLIGTFVMVITFFALFIMLIVRHITLSILLILMPAVWLMWVFPGLNKHWHDWWGRFLRWAFFAPVMMFFMYLVISVGAIMNSGGTDGNPLTGTDLSVSASSPKDLNKGIANATGDVYGPMIEATFRGLVLAGLIIGGLFAANKLSITGADATLKGIKGFGKGAGKGVARWTGRQTGGRLAGRIFRPPEPKIDKKTGVQKPLGALGKMRQRVHERAAEEKGKGEKGLASVLAGYGVESQKRKSKNQEILKKWESGGGVVGGVGAKILGEETMRKVAKPLYYATAPIRGAARSMFGFNKNSLMGSVTFGGLKGAGIIKSSSLKIKQEMTEEEVAALGWTNEYAQSLGIKVKKRGGATEETESKEERMARLQRELDQELATGENKKS